MDVIEKVREFVDQLKVIEEQQYITKKPCFTRFFVVFWNDVKLIDVLYEA